MSRNLFLTFCILFLIIACHHSEPIQKSIENPTTQPSQNLLVPQDQTGRTPRTLPTPVLPESPSEKIQQKIEPPKPEIKNPWPPEGPNCREFVDCCEEAQKIRGKVSMLCLSIASRQPVDCEKGLQEVVNLLKSLKVSIPRYCE